MNKYFGPILNGWTLQTAGNSFMDNVIHFHNIVLCILFFILFIVTWFLVTVLVDFGKPQLRLNLYLYMNSLLIKYGPKLDLYYLLFIIILPMKFKAEYGSVKTFINSLYVQLNDGNFFTKHNLLLIFFTVFLKNNVHKYGTQSYYKAFLKHFNTTQCNPYIFYNNNVSTFFFSK